jgi:hypothetical protein
VPIGFYKWVSFEVFSGFFQVFLGFFQVLGAPTGEKQNPHHNPVLRGLGSGSGHGCKNAPEPASVGCKTRGLPKTWTWTAIPNCIKLNKSLYSLKQSERMWHNRLNEFLLNKGYSNNDDYPCVFIHKSSTEFCIISVYVDDLNIIATELDINEAQDHFKMEFEMKDLGKTKFCLVLLLEHLLTRILVHQSTYVHKILEKFNMYKAYSSKALIVVRALKKDSDPFWPRQEGEEVLGSEYPYLNVIGALMYLVNNTRPDIAFTVNLIIRFNAAPTIRHWNGIKDVLRYLWGTPDPGLFYSKNQDLSFIDYADVRYLSDPRNDKFQTGFIFLHGGMTIS